MASTNVRLLSGPDGASEARAEARRHYLSTYERRVVSSARAVAAAQDALEADYLALKQAKANAQNWWPS